MRKTQFYKSIPYNPDLRERAKFLRKAGILHEAVFWNHIKGKIFQGIDFDRQKIIGNYIVDFYCAEKGIVIELDGISHDEKSEYDQKRDSFLEGLGLNVIHLNARDVLNNIQAVMMFLQNHPAFCTPRLEGNGVTYAQ